MHALRQIVIISSSASLLCGLVMSFLCRLSAQSSPSEPAARVFVQLILSQLGLADAVFSFSFLLAQARNGTSDGGWACQLGAVLNEYGGIVSTWWTVIMAHAVSRALLHPHRSVMPLPFSITAATVWGIPFVVEAVLFFTLYEPRGWLGPQVSLPWCHWKRDDMAMSLLLYLNVGVAIGYVTLAYGHVHLRSRALHAEALLQEGAAEAAEAVAATSHRLWTLDLRLASYHLAYVFSQTPSVVHRVWEACAASWPTRVSSPPYWIAVSQASTQPTQGLLNAVVFIHQARCTPHSLALDCRACLRRAMRPTERSTILTATVDHESGAWGRPQ